MDILHNPDLAQLLMRLPIGLFFMIRGAQKLMCSTRRAGLMRTLVADHFPCVTFFAWWIVSWEFVAGLLLVAGLFTHFAAAVIGLICLVALLTDKITEVKVKRNPQTKCDWLCCMLYVSEVPMGLICTAIILSGVGAYSLDALL